MSRLLFTWVALVMLIMPSYCLSSISEDISEVIEGRSSHSTDAGKMVVELANLTSTHLYNLDERQLNQTIIVIFEANSRLQAVSVKDYATQEVVTSFFRDDSGNLSRGNIPESLNRYQMAREIISYGNSVIGLVEIRYQSADEANRLDVFSKNIIALLVIFSIFVSLLAIIFKLLSKNLGGNIYLTFGTQKFARLIIGAISVFVVMTFSACVVMLEHNKANIVDRASYTFHHYLTSLDKTLNTVHEIRDKTFQYILSKPEFVRYLREINNAIEAGDDRAKSLYSSKMAQLWSKYREFSASGAKVILSKDLKVIYSQGEPINYLDNPFYFNDTIHRAFKGESKLLPIEVKSDEETGLTNYRMVFLAPVFDMYSDEVLAVTIIEIADKEILYHDFSEYDFANTGEMMAFDKDGHILSSPRFVVNKDRIDEEKVFIQSMLEKLEVHGFNNNLAGIYEVIDYRGQAAYAMLNWNPALNVALVAKVDTDEIFDAYYGFRRGLFFIVMAMVAFTVPCLLFTLYAGNLSNQRLKDSRREIINRLGHAAEFKDNETALHIFRMSRYTEVLACNLKMPADWIDLVSDAAPMHDIGKIGVPDAVLQKPGKLTPEEWDIMKKHPKFGADIIGHHTDSKLLSTAREIALCHHEKWNGTGYPEGLSGEAIPLSARIVSIADVFDALTSSRPYKKAWSFEDAVNLIISESGKHFDPKLVSVFKESLPEFKYIMTTYNDKTLDQHNPS